MPSKLTPIGAAAEKLAEAGVPLPSIVSMIESHYAAALKESEAQLRDALVGNLHLETLQAALRKQSERNDDLAARINVAVERSNALQNFRTNASPARAALAESSTAANDEQLLQMAEDQRAAASLNGSRHQTSAANLQRTATVTPSATGQSMTLASRLSQDQLQRQLDTAKADLQTKTIALDRERGLRRRLESENHSLNMHALGLHDEMSRLSGIVDATRTRLREQTSVFDRDRQDLLSQASELRRELQSTRQRAESEAEALSGHVDYLTRELQRLRVAHEELQNDYNVVARRSDSFDRPGSPGVAGATTTRRSPTPTGGGGGGQSAVGGGGGSASLEAVRGLQVALDAMTARAVAAEDEAARLRQLLEARDAAALAATPQPRAPHLLSLATTTPPRAAVCARRLEPKSEPLAIEDRRARSTTPPPAQQGPGAGKGGATHTAAMINAELRGPAHTPPPSWASAKLPENKRVAAPRKRQSEHDSFRKGADPDALLRLRGPATIVTIDGARAFTGSLSPTRLQLRPKPHRVKPLAASASGEATEHAPKPSADVSM